MVSTNVGNLPEIFLNQQVGDLYQIDELLEASAYDRSIGVLGRRKMDR